MDREKVIEGLEICSEHGSWHGLDCEHNEAYKDCPYRGCETGCVVTIAKDAIALLKEQEYKDIMFHALENDWKALLKEQEEKPLRCKTCTMRDKTRFCHRWNIEVKDDDYCSFGAWKGC